MEGQVNQALDDGELVGAVLDQAAGLLALRLRCFSFFVFFMAAWVKYRHHFLVISSDIYSMTKIK